MYIGLSIVSLMMLFISSIISICLGRMFSGIAIGALILQLPTYASEIVEVSTHYRYSIDYLNEILISL